MKTAKPKTELRLTPAGDAFMDALFPKPLDVQNFLEICGTIGRVGSGINDYFRPDEDLKEGRYWSENIDPEECPEEWAAGGFTEEGAMRFTSYLMSQFLWSSQNFAAKGRMSLAESNFDILTDLSLRYKMSMFGVGKIPTEIPAEPCVYVADIATGEPIATQQATATGTE